MFANIIQEQLALANGDNSMSGNNSRPFTPELSIGSTNRAGIGSRGSVFFTDLKGTVDNDSEEYNNALFREAPPPSSTTNTASSTNAVAGDHSNRVGTPVGKNRNAKTGNPNALKNTMNMPLHDLLNLAKTFTLDPQDRLPGGIAHYSATEASKYFGVEAKVQFSAQCKKVHQQRNIIQSSANHRIPKDVVDMMELVNENTHDKKPANHNEHSAFSPNRPPLPLKMNTKVVIRTQSLSQDSLYSEMKLLQKPVELQSFDHLLQPNKTNSNNNNNTSTNLNNNNDRPNEPNGVLNFNSSTTNSNTMALLQSPIRTPRLQPLNLTSPVANTNNSTNNSNTNNTDSSLLSPDSARKVPKSSAPHNAHNSGPLPPLQAAILKHHDVHSSSSISHSNNQSGDDSGRNSHQTSPRNGSSHNTQHTHNHTHTHTQHHHKHSQHNHQTGHNHNNGHGGHQHSKEHSFHSNTNSRPDSGNHHHSNHHGHKGHNHSNNNNSNHPFHANIQNKTTVHAKRASLRRMSSIFGGLSIPLVKEEHEEVSLHDLGEMYKVHKHTGQHEEDDDNNSTSNNNNNNNATNSGDDSNSPNNGTNNGTNNNSKKRGKSTKENNRKVSMTTAMLNEAAKSNYSGAKAMTMMPLNSPSLELVCVDYRDPNNQKIGIKSSATTNTTNNSNSVDNSNSSNSASPKKMVSSLFEYVEAKQLQRDFYDANDSDHSDVEEEILMLRHQRETILATNPTRAMVAKVTQEHKLLKLKQQSKLNNMNNTNNNNNNNTANTPTSNKNIATNNANKNGKNSTTTIPNTAVAKKTMAPIRINKMKIQAAQRQELRNAGKSVSVSSRFKNHEDDYLPPFIDINSTNNSAVHSANNNNTNNGNNSDINNENNVHEFDMSPHDDTSVHKSNEKVVEIIRMWNDTTHNNISLQDIRTNNNNRNSNGMISTGHHNGDNNNNGNLSPRSLFIDNCLRANINPRASLILRKIYTKELHLKHLGMGNTMACLLAEAIVHIPYIESLNVCDNNLTDSGLTAIVQAITQMKFLSVLDMSFNEIGPEAAKALNTYLGNPNSPLTRLILEKADVDDDECRDFIEALHTNQHLLELTLNDNQVGSSENLNTVMPDIVTGGEAIAALLSSPSCPLQTLRLGWNMIRLGGAADLCQSLSLNASLTFLELSYNALGVSGGIALGDALQDNKVLKHLLVANNSLDSVATMVICAGILENSNLEYVCFDENPIGQQGAMVLMLLPTIVGSRVVVSARNCNLNIRDNNNWFDSTAIVRTYDLDLTNPFDRSVGIVISYLVPSHQTYLLAHGEYYHPEKQEWQDLQLKELVDKESYKLKPMDPEQFALIEGLIHVREATRDIQKAIALFEKVDLDGSGQLDEDEFAVLLKMMGMDNKKEKVMEIMSEYDVDGGGVIEMTEFLLFLKSQQKKASKRLKELTEISVLASLLDNPYYQAPTGSSPPPSAPKLAASQHRTTISGKSSNNPNGNNSLLAMALLNKSVVENPVKRYLPPRVGRLRMTVVDGFTQKETFRVISPGDRTNILKIAEQSGEMVQMTTFGMKNYRIRLSEALTIVYRLLKENSNKVKVLATVLPQMATPADAKALVFEVLGYNLVDVARLKREIGQAYRVIMGQPDGFFNLDLSNEMDRFCLNRLLEISMTTAHFRSVKRNALGYGRLGDTSQHGNFTCFRNEIFNKKPAVINTEFASPLPKHGKIEFDFCAQKRYKADNFALTDVRFTNLLVKTFQLDASERLKALEALNRTRIACDKTLKGDGRTIYETPKDRALEMGQFASVFQEKLHERTEQIDRYRQKESVKVTWEFDPTQTQLRMSNFHTVYKIPSIFKRTAGHGNHSVGHSGLDVAKSSSKSAAVAIGGAMMLRKSALATKKLLDDQRKKSPLTLENPLNNANIAEPAAPDVEELKLPSSGRSTEGTNNNNNNNNPKSQPSSKPNSSRSNKNGETSGNNTNNSSTVVPAGIAVSFSGDTPPLSRSETPLPPGGDRGISSAKDSTKRSVSAKSGVSTARSSMNGDENDIYGNLQEGDDEDNEEGDNDEDEEEDPLEKESDQLMEMINSNSKTAGNQNTLPKALARASTVRRLNDVIQPKSKRKPKKAVDDDGFDIEEVHPYEENGDDNDSVSSEDTEAEEERLREEERKQRQEKPLNELWNRYVCLMGSTNVPIQAKAVRTLELLVEAFESQFFYARHLEMLVLIFEEFGTLKNTEDFGTYRVELIVQLFGCVIDLHNFEIVMRRLTSFEAACVLTRIGILNIFNPMKPEGSYELDMTQRDQRTVLKMLAQLACVEPGDNLPFIQFRWERFMDPMPGFELTENWMTEDGLPRKGVLDCTYYAGEGKCKNGCKPSIKFRKALLQLVLIEEEEVISEAEHDFEKEFVPVGVPFIQTANPATWLGYLAYNETYAKNDSNKRGNGNSDKNTDTKKKK